MCTYMYIYVCAHVQIYIYIYTCIITPVWTKWERANDRAVTVGDLKHMESQKLHFLIKAVYDILPTPVNLHA